MDGSEEYIKMEMECEPKKPFRKGRPCSRQTGILVLLGTVCIIIFIIMTSVIFSHQERKFSVLESWMNSHTSDLTSVKSDFQSTGGDLEKKVSELQNLVSSLSSSLNMSGSSNPMTNEMQEKLSKIETLMTDLGSSHSDQEEKLQNLVDSLMSCGVPLRSYSRIQRISNLRTPSCTDPGWVPFRNRCYLFSSNTMNWTQAKDYCEKQGALLLKIEEGSESEWQFVSGYTNSQGYWVGLTDQNTGQWRWADDTPYTMNKEHWKPGNPDDWTEHGLGEEGEEGEDCGQIAYGLLNDIHCSSKLKYICEKGI